VRSMLGSKFISHDVFIVLSLAIKGIDASAVGGAGCEWQKD